MKICPECNIKHSYSTILCSKCYRKKWYLKNKKRLKEYQREYRKNNLEKRREIEKNAAFKYRYGITKFEFEEIFKKQKYRCIICNAPQTDLKKIFCLDHNHVNYKTRGVLCKECNSGLGFFKDNIEYLEKAIAYLKDN